MRKVSLKEAKTIVAGSKGCYELVARMVGAQWDGNFKRAERFQRRATRKGCNIADIADDFKNNAY